MRQQLMAWEFPLKSAGNATPSTCRLKEYWPETTLNTNAIGALSCTPTIYIQVEKKRIQKGKIDGSPAQVKIELIPGLDTAYAEVIPVGASISNTVPECFIAG